MRTHFKRLEKPVTQGLHTWGDLKKLNIFAGPDIIEDEGMVLEVALELKKITQELGIGWILKCSFDKANRQSIDSFRGPGIKKALESFARIKSKVGCELLTDVHEEAQMAQVAEMADVIQIPAFLCRQTDLVVAAAKTGKTLHIKKGQFMAPEDMQSIAQKAYAAGNTKVLIGERGTTFGYHRLINDMLGLVEMREAGTPVIMDITHSTQRPGALNGKSGGRGDLAPALARAALGVGVDGLFIETHPDPKTALCDGPTSIPLSEMRDLLSTAKSFWDLHVGLVNAD